MREYRDGVEILSEDADCKISRIDTEIKVRSSAKGRVGNTGNILDIVTQVRLDVSDCPDLP